MSDRDLLISIHATVDKLSADFAAHLGEHKALAGAVSRRWGRSSVVVAWLGFALAVAVALLK